MDQSRLRLLMEQLLVITDNGKRVNKLQLIRLPASSLGHED